MTSELNVMCKISGVPHNRTVGTAQCRKEGVNMCAHPDIIYHTIYNIPGPITALVHCIDSRYSFEFVPGQKAA